MKQSTRTLITSFANDHVEMQYLLSDIEKTVGYIAGLNAENKILLCGNGGSAADCEHFSGELLKSFMKKRPVKKPLRDELIALFPDGKEIADNLQEGVKAIPLPSFTSAITAFSNDCSSQYVFAQLVNALGIKNDVLIAFSTSGNSANVVLAAKTAKAKGMKVISFTGKSGGKLKEYSDILLNVPSDLVWKIQEMHLPLYHLICLCVENESFDE